MKTTDFRNTQTYTHLHMEAATCLWEAMLEERDYSTLHFAFKDRGTVEMRHSAIELADTVLKVWDVMTEDERERVIPYDWEFVPRFLRQVTWVDGIACLPDNPRKIADLILASL